MSQIPNVLSYNPAARGMTIKTRPYKDLVSVGVYEAKTGLHAALEYQAKNRIHKKP